MASDTIQLPRPALMYRDIQPFQRLALGLVLILSGCGALPNLIKPSYESVVAQFEATVTAAEFSPRGNPSIVRKWTGPVHYAVINADAFQAAIVRSNMDVLRALTGLQIVQVGNIKQSNFRIFFGNQAELRGLLADFFDGERMARELARSSCFANLKATGGGVIQYAQAGIGKENRGHLMRHCMLEELVQAFGPVNDACHFRPSLFCDLRGSYNVGLTWGDEIIIKTLYDRRLKPGMTREQAMPLARKIIAELFDIASGA